MAKQKQLKLLEAGVSGWNKWRSNWQNNNQSFTVDLSGANLVGAELGGADLNRANFGSANLQGANLRQANLIGANLRGADLREAKLSRTYLICARLIKADLSGANLRRADLSGANLSGATLIRANLNGADLSKADLSGADLSEADLSEADLSDTNLSRANLSEANLTRSNLVQAVISDAKISRSNIYGINVWDLRGEFREQKEFIITKPGETAITVDNIEIAQFIYLILNNKKIREVINTLTSKTVLILGRFAIPERKKTLDALRDKLREYDLLPIVFDFDRPIDKDFTETIKTLASISYFVIADITNPKSSPLELQATVPDYQIPFVPIIQEGELPFAMMADLQKKYNWVLDTISYDSLDTLIKILKPHIIDPAIKKRDELKIIKAAEPTIISGKELLSKK